MRTSLQNLKTNSSESLCSNIDKNTEIETKDKVFWISVPSSEVLFHYKMEVGSRNFHYTMEINDPLQPPY